MRNTEIVHGLHVCARMTLCATMLSACAMTIHNEPINRPLAVAHAEPVDLRQELPANDDDVVVGLAFSGGGMRAAAFSYGVLSEFERTKVRLKGASTSLLDRVDFVSGVSGGAITAAYFGLKGRAELHEFRDRFLLRNAEESLSTSVISPVNYYRAYEGGMNEPEMKIIDVFVCKLRKKLANASNGKNYIETVWGRGYVLRNPTDDEVRIPTLTAVGS